ncbi:hypothetical protein EDD18DRAFT_45040 [Armillaria luteobubalina]|uniref:Uncharacterized protein n=1 Tax=Armillaria luteobubalina TaxID=153913 RepID=A0AA39QQX6_9AGAR|nr:hypothetical protein EDD18DRAFT_45040 [Armillaria luteobubalina]
MQLGDTQKGWIASHRPTPLDHIPLSHMSPYLQPTNFEAREFAAKNPIPYTRVRRRERIMTQARTRSRVDRPSFRWCIVVARYLIRTDGEASLMSAYYIAMIGNINTLRPAVLPDLYTKIVWILSLVVSLRHHRRLDEYLVQTEGYFQRTVYFADISKASINIGGDGVVLACWKDTCRVVYRNQGVTSEDRLHSELGFLLKYRR